ncbi:MAG: circadian clock protein KaiA [Microcoleus sp. PH2017_10_PVI_O_A]|nr:MULTISPECIES: circadian clock protein KaiA [unclassified Microcoleus]TAE76538.1 MAG: circadian clock protein KaiA [Oscillatoriales cyanobacterium]MCC3409277.1 circadian clock protein KaiA [Microcoleus sp. PH2017_10_PVI_O_A]MCC3463510.1 circadian clock protein KaiA [Microcoleus sp. PH2017_11_PCY_U_A]MCC3481865.1 circadian clock protein KaiA [Microcoleus sp. PH2017_12_PCY_D_A]MCC3531056.1 circadian clock protein KaiA [Microcoleus sp. PH2017_21_RUC_O_A]
MLPQLSIGIFIRSEKIASDAIELLSGERYTLTHIKSAVEFLGFLKHNYHLDCLVFDVDRDLQLLLGKLQERSLFLPAVIFLPQPAGDGSPEAPPPDALEGAATTAEKSQKQSCAFFYHPAEVQLSIARSSYLGASIDRAIAQFLKLSTPVPVNDQSARVDATAQLTAQSLLQRQQRRLAEKLRERLGYLGVYYKRNSQIFLRNLSGEEKQKFLEQLKLSYRDIVLHYFSEDTAVNNQIDEFVNLAFFADVPVTQIVEIHMELMDEFAKQLKLEGRSEEILLDYRLTLIDAIAHLCEMYRRSIPKETSQGKR